MRLAMLNVDWKDDFARDEVAATRKRVGGDAFMFEIVQDHVDDRIMYVCDEYLTRDQLTRLWEVGDLMLTDRDVWEAESFDALLAMIAEYVENVED